MPSLPPLRVRPDESLQKTHGDRPLTLCCVTKVGTCACSAGTTLGLRWAWVCRGDTKALGVCGKVWRIELRTLCMQSRRGVLTSFSRNFSPPSWLLFSRKKPMQSLSQHTQLVSPRQPHRTSLLRSGPAQGPGAWPGQVPVTRPVLWLLTLLASGPTLWPQHHLMPNPASLQSQMPTLLLLVG